MKPKIKLTGAIAAALLLAACDDPLYTNLSEREANRMVALLRQQDISASRAFDAEARTYTISVSSSQFASAVSILEANNLPSARFVSLGDVFAAQGLVTSPFEERARFVHAMNQELSHSISGIKGVMEARVHLVIPEGNPLDPGTEKARASVFVYHSRHFSIPINLPKIKMAIANSVDKLSYENVSVMTFDLSKNDG